MCTLDICTMQIFGTVAINTKKMMTKMGHMIRDMKVMPEIEVFDTGDLVFADDLIAEGALDGPGVFSIVMGTKYGIPADPEAMIYCKNRLPKGAVWQGFGVSKHNLADGGAIGDPGRQCPHRLRGFDLSRPGQAGEVERHDGDAGGRADRASSAPRSRRPARRASNWDCPTRRAAKATHRRGGRLGRMEGAWPRTTRSRCSICSSRAAAPSAPSSGRRKYALAHKGFDVELVPGGFTGIQERTKGFRRSRAGHHRRRPLGEGQLGDRRISRREISRAAGCCSKATA